MNGFRLFWGEGEFIFGGAGRWRRGVAGVVKSDVVSDSGGKCGRGVERLTREGDGNA